MKSKKKVLSSLFSLLSPSFSTPFFSYRNGQVHSRSYAITAILYNGIVICALLLPIGIQTYKSQLRSIKRKRLRMPLIIWQPQSFFHTSY